MVEVTEQYNGGFIPKQPYLNEARSRKIILWLLAISFAYAAGFFVFAFSLSFKSEFPDERTDAIIALTGEEKRITESVRELAKGSSDRLFISGVYRRMPIDRIVDRTLDELARDGSRKTDRDGLRAKISKPHGKAENTIENGIESGKWVKENGVHSVRLMTSYYHMPRSMLIFRRYMPKDTVIIPHPVMLSSAKPDFTSDPLLMKMLFSEYNKYIVTYLWNMFGFESTFITRIAKEL
jgi:uncharacterized SAM-binding protein YcdF (DUF218 family)